MTTVAAETRIHTMHFGPLAVPGGTRFRFWAPKMSRPRLAIEGREPLAMQPAEPGWFEATVAAGPGTRYRFLLDDGAAVPDPASRFQPEGPHGPSEVIDPAAYRWRQADWTGRPWAETVLYEMHVGTFTGEGTYAAAARRLADLADLGVTAVELLPLSTFSGRHGWGYDGVLPFAPHPAYGRPDELKAFVDEAHRLGLQVFLDVVYNHFGPDGNYIPRHAPVFTAKHASPWGEGVNVDDEGSADVRDFFEENAAYWIDEYFMDGLRFDAVHAIVDESPVHLLEELATRVRRVGGERHVHLVLENGDNEPRWLDGGQGTPGRYDAQWNDDIHHALHAALTGEDGGYYRAFAEEAGLLPRAVAEGFARVGQTLADEVQPGEPSGHLPPSAFVSFLQNHDQVGNRALGDRITSTVPDHGKVRAAAAVYLLAPQIPMLFMGEEWAASTPFPFFCDFDEPLAEAVRKGRREEFARFPEFSDPAVLARLPDPVARSTFEAAKLDWREREADGHRDMLDWYRRILAVRGREIVPLVPRIRRGGRATDLGDRAFTVRWEVEGGGALHLLANLSPAPVGYEARDLGRTVWTEGAAGERSAAPWSVRFAVSER